MKLYCYVYEKSGRSSPPAIGVLSQRAQRKHGGSIRRGVVWWGLTEIMVFSEVNWRKRYVYCYWCHSTVDEVASCVVGGYKPPRAARLRNRGWSN